MKYVKTILATFVLLAFLMSGLTAMVAISSPTENNTIRAPGDIYTVSKNVQSAHPYSNNMDQWWTIQESGAAAMRLRLYVDVESNYDYLYLYDADYNQIRSYTGKTSWHWTQWIDGDTVRIRLVTDYSVTKYGFRTYKYQYEEGGAPPADTEAPSVTINSPSAGATVSGTTSISFTATDNVGVTSRKISIDGSQVSTSSSYSWDTTGYSNGQHTILCEAWDAAGNKGSDQITVTVDNQAPPSNNELTSGETVYSSLSATGDTEMWTIEVGADATNMNSVLNCGSQDYDLYGRLGTEPTTSTYDWRGYTGGGENVDFANPGAGTWYIMVRSYSGSGSYDLTVTITYGGGGGGGDWGTGGKYAIVIGISDYQSISDLSYCDEDATDWYNFLTAQGYEVHVYGDNHQSNYPRYDGLATEANVRSAIQGLAAHAQAGDQVVITTSGHGGADETNGWYYSGGGATNDVTFFLCMYDSSGGSSGNYYESEFASDLNGFASGIQTTIIVDHCHSGGMIPNLQALTNSGDILYQATCTGNGYGYDEPTYSNGKFSYWMLQAFSNGQTTWEAAFDWIMVSGRYLPVDNAADNPQEFDGNTGVNYTP